MTIRRNFKLTNWQPYFYFLFITLIGCNTTINEPTPEINSVAELAPDTAITPVDTPKMEAISTPVSQEALSLYLDHPLDFYQLKKEAGSMHSGGLPYLKNSDYHSIDDDSYIHYGYWAINQEPNKPDIDMKNKAIDFQTLKPWKTSVDQYFETDNEILTGIQSRIAWDGFQNSNFVGQSEDEITSRFGEPTFTKDDCSVYKIVDKVLVLNIKKAKVQWFRYVWLNEKYANTEDLPNGLYKW